MKRFTWILLATMVFILLGCSDGGDGRDTGDTGETKNLPDGDTPDGDSPSADGDDWDPVDGDTPDGDSPFDGGDDWDAPDGDTPEDGDDWDPSDDGDDWDASDGDSPDGDEGVDGDEQGGISAGQMTAGEWRDLDNWDFWLGLFQQSAWTRMPTHWGFDTTQRFRVEVKSGGVPVADAVVQLFNGNQTPIFEAKTDTRGRADLFAGLFDSREQTGTYSLTASKFKSTVTLESVSPQYEEPIVVEMTAAPGTEETLDLMFMVDTTGSMGDELEYLQSELEDVILTVDGARRGNTRIRLSVNFYRDHGDSYVVREFPFTENVDKAVAQIRAQSAAGGGDFEEAVDKALESAISGHQWSQKAKARLLFLVLDAPPHHRDKVIQSIHNSVIEAARQGIRIIPVTASGIDKETEFLMRFLDIATGGTYVFVTDHSGIGNGHLEPTIGPYEVEMLNDLLVRLILDALDPQ